MNELEEAERAVQSMKALGIDVDDLENGLAPVDLDAPLAENTTPILSAQDYLDAYRVKPEDSQPKPDFIMQIGDIPTFPTGDLQAVKAKSKNGKTMLCCILAAATIANTDFNTTPLHKNASVLYIDTEQNPSNTTALAQRIKSLAHDPKDFNEHFTSVCFRKLNPDARRDGTKMLIQELKPTLTIIDGIADLIENFNDIEASQDLVNELMQLSIDNNTAILNVLHTNKQKGDENMKGHLGTLLLQKASDVLESKIINDTFVVNETDSRNQQINNFAFKLNNNVIPIPTEIPTTKKTKHNNTTSQPNKPTNAQLNIEKSKQIIQQNPNSSKAKLTKLIAQQLNVSIRTARRYLQGT